MKKAQTTIEYLFCIILAVVACWGVSVLWNRHIIIQNATIGTEDAEGVVHVRPLGN